MSDETEDHTIRLLQEMRQDMKDLRGEMRSGFDDVNTRIDGLSHIVTLLAANTGGHDQRIEILEDAVSKLSKD